MRNRLCCKNHATMLQGLVVMSQCVSGVAARVVGACARDAREFARYSHRDGRILSSSVSQFPRAASEIFRFTRPDLRAKLWLQGSFNKGPEKCCKQVATCVRTVVAKLRFFPVCNKEGGGEKVTDWRLLSEREHFFLNM